jgi:hypothetical protein
MEGIGVGKKAELPFSFLREDDPGDFLIFKKDIIPDGDELLERKGELKEFFERLEEFQRGYFSDFITVDRSVFKIEEIRKNLGGVLKFFSLGESREFFCNLVMVERKNDIAQIVKDDFDGWRKDHFLPPTLSPRGRGEE